MLGTLSFSITSVSYTHLFLFDYGTTPTVEDLNQKPDAIPYYPEGVRLVDHEYTLSSGKRIKFDCMTGKGEQEFM